MEKVPGLLSFNGGVKGVQENDPVDPCLGQGSVDDLQIDLQVEKIAQVERIGQFNHRSTKMLSISSRNSRGNSARVNPDISQASAAITAWPPEAGDDRQIFARASGEGAGSSDHCPGWWHR